MVNEQDDIRILLVDDEQAILDIYSETLGFEGKQYPGERRFSELENRLFKENGKKSSWKNIFDFTRCNQAEEAVLAVKQSVENNRPYAMVFMDVRMPPGRDGFWAAEQIFRLDPLINIVLVSAYNDVTLTDIDQKISSPGRLLFAQKPLLILEIAQIARVMVAKWQAEKSLAERN